MSRENGAGEGVDGLQLRAETEVGCGTERQLGIILDVLQEQRKFPECRGSTECLSQQVNVFHRVASCARKLIDSCRQCSSAEAEPRGCTPVCLCASIPPILSRMELQTPLAA